MPPELPGAKQWYASTFGVIPSADWSDYEGGMVRFEDGTVWAFITELHDYAAGYSFGSGLRRQGFIYHIMIFELLPDQSGWEQITPDNWAMDDNYYSGDLMPAAGSIQQYPFVGDQAIVVYPGTGPWVYFGYDTGFLARINKDTRLYEIMNRESDNNTLFENSVNWGYLYTVDDDYMWYISSVFQGVSTLVRKSLIPPYGDEIITEWDTASIIGGGNPAFWQRDSTGKPYGAYDNVLPGQPSDGFAIASDDNYLYFFWSNEEKPVASEPSLEGTFINWQEKTLTTIKRCSKTAPYTLETLLWGDLQRSSDRYSEDRGEYGAYGFDQDFGAFPTHTGILAGQNARAAVRDGWLYWLDYGSEFNSHINIWRAGSQFRRINLEMFETTNLPIKFDPENPPFEILSNASANHESHARTNYYADRVTHWRDGAYPLHSATGGGSWYFEEDGSIVFMHREFDEIFYYDNTRTWWPIMRLTPPDSSNNTFQVSLIFEGNALKGYGPVHQHPASYVPEEVFLQ